MMSTVVPDHHNHNNNFTSINTKKHLDKHQHSIKWKANESILEFGFGNGKCSEDCLQPILPNDYNEFVVLEISKEMIELVQQSIKIPRVQFVLEDIANQNIPGELETRFDHIFGFFAMHHVENPSQAFKNIYKMLKSGGQMFVTFLERKPNDEALANLAKHPIWRDYLNLTSPYYYKDDPRGEYEKNIQEAGFTNYIFDVISERQDFGEEMTDRKLMHTVNPAMANVPEEKIEEYRKAYVEELRKSKSVELNEDGNQIKSISYRICVVIASKLE